MTLVMPRLQGKDDNLVLLVQSSDPEGWGRSLDPTGHFAIITMWVRDGFTKKVSTGQRSEQGEGVNTVMWG